MSPDPVYPFEADFSGLRVGLPVIELHLLHIQFNREGSDFVLIGLLPQRLQGDDAYIQQIDAGQLLLNVWEKKKKRERGRVGKATQG